MALDVQAMRFKTLKINGLACASCAAKIEQRLKAEFGPQAELNFAAGKVTIPPDSLRKAQSIIDSIESGVTIEARDEFQTYSITGLHCANCAAKIDARFKEAYGPEASLNFGSAKITIPEGKVDDAQGIIDSVESGVQIEVESRQSGAQRSGLPIPLSQTISLSTAIVLFALGLIYRSALRDTPYSIAEYLVFLTAYFIVGRNVISAAAKNLARGSVFDENFLMTIATVGAVGLGELPEAVGVMLFYYIGEMFQDLSVRKSRSSIQALMDIRPDYANLKEGSDTRRVHPEDVAVGAAIVVRPGERIPLDGEVLEGETFVDTSALTGESVPVRVRQGETILAGSINTSGLITVRVSKAFADSSLAKILDLVENATNRKAPTERFITKFSRVYTPAVVVAAAALALIPPLVIPGATFADWIHRALILLVISCPCALVVSIPLGYFGGIGGASRRGVLVKGANYLDALVNVDTVVFDKTGTLTEGVFKVTKVNPAQGFSSEQLLRETALAESYSNHPIAVSILEAYGKPFDQSLLGDYEEIAGHGLRAMVDGREVVVGNSRLMEREGVTYDPWLQSGTVVYTAVAGVYAGSIVISDRVKADASKAINELKRLGVAQTVMLTGDNKSVAEQVSRELGLDQVYANLLPEDKVNRVEELLGRQGKGKKLAFVGDGINDAPVITRADVGIAMGGLGSDAAIEAADLVIMQDMPSKLVTAVRIAKGTRSIVIQNIVLALATKGLFIALGAVGMATMWEAIFADVGIALLAILNSTRALRIRA